MATKRPNRTIVRSSQGPAPKASGLKNSRASFLSSRRFWKWVGIGGLTLLVFFLLSAIWLLQDLPGPNGIKNDKTAVNTILYDRTGKNILYQIHGDINRDLISFDDMPAVVRDSTIAIEDKNYYHHGAIDPAGVARAGIYDLTHHGLVQGGSTLTQQFIKNAVLTDQRSVWRKYKEIVMSEELELLYSKNDILRMYLNEIPYGSQAYGIQAASQTFFGIDAKDLGDGSSLSLSRSATLAAMLNAPTFYSPYGTNTDLLIDRRNLVLQEMQEQGYISKDQQKAAAALTLTDLNFKPQSEYQDTIAPHFVEYVREQLVDKYGEKAVDEGGLKVVTTLDSNDQKIAQSVVTKYAKINARDYNATNAALVSADPKTGQVLAMVGSADFNDTAIDGNVNVATASRQPGSSFKPFVYATAWKKNYFPGSTLYDLTTDFGGGYKPSNYSHEQNGPVGMRQAIDGSLNIPAVKTLYLAGIGDSIQTAHDMGITTLNADPSTYGLALVLGAGGVKLTDMVAGYGTFADNGVAVPQKVILKVTDQKGHTLEDNTKTPKGKQAIDPQVAYEMQNVLSDNNARAFVFGSHSPLTLGSSRPVAAKTGTTDSFRDGWTLGFTPQVVTGVWTGNSDDSPMVSGSDGVVTAGPIWHDYMQQVLAGQPVEQFVQPPGIQKLTVDSLTGRKPGPGTRQTRTDIAASWVTLQSAPNSASQSYRIDKVSGKLATNLTPPGAIETISGSEVVCELPSSDPSYQRWFAPEQAWAASHGYGAGGGQSIPTEYDDVHVPANFPTISINSPPDGGVSGNPVTVFMTVSAPLQVDHVTVTVDGSQTVTATGPGGTGGTYTAQVPITGSGQHTFQATVYDQAFDSATSDNISVTVAGAGGGGGSSFNGPLVCNMGTNVIASISGNPGTVWFLKNGNFVAVANKSGNTYKHATSGSAVYTFEILSNGRSESTTCS
jgi:membrane peptidoglycan carboxypeptidase